MLGQGVYFREDNKVYPPNPLIVCIDATEDGDVVNYCAVIADYNPLPTYTQNKNAVTIDNGMEGEVSADFETIVFKEVFYKSRNNNDGTTTREQEVAMVTYQKQ